MALPTLSRLQLTPDINICRILNGMWQVSGGHGRIDPTAAIQEMFRYVDAGFTTWDLADHYGPAEDLMGEFRRQLLATRGKEALDHWGGWQLFQELLVVLKQIATKHTVSIANVAVRYILDKPAIGGVIIGARLGLSEHLQDNARVFEFSLDDDDRQQIDAVSQKSRDLYRAIGDCGDEYR
ncbi:unnamed protein product [Rotaria sordida]|uniref:NADP-dependent oxidoreductase domain-containing protein n=1 Tax=Rotaria sordida TaxID=392033 RepID=A0A813Y6P2_9BILA|nr:unnamed protein product [Rotaria sordida]CAF0864561.1 unnamed protein product [Rotaria sordida]CAF0877866.1 unnamed protein product [Rotaria sordida]CAF3643075.1 unnamed protein product [Rotaria sordida]